MNYINMDFKNIYKKFNENTLSDFNDIALKDTLKAEGVNVIKFEIETMGSYNGFITHKSYEIGIRFNNIIKKFIFLLEASATEEDLIEVFCRTAAEKDVFIGHARNINGVAELIHEYIDNRLAESSNNTEAKMYLTRLEDVLKPKALKKGLKCGFFRNSLLITYTVEEDDYTETLAEINCNSYRSSKELCFKVEYTFVPHANLVDINDDQGFYDRLSDNIIFDIENLLQSGAEDFKSVLS